MADIDVGNDAIDRDTSVGNTRTCICKDNPANATGTITKVQLFYDNANGENVKVGSFSASGDDLTPRDYDSLGTVAFGSTQTITGCTIDIVLGDHIGEYHTGGILDADATGGDGKWHLDGDQFDAGEQTYGLWTGPLSVYGEGETEAPPGLESKSGGMAVGTVQIY